MIQTILESTAAAVKELYGAEVDPESIVWNETRKEFEGDYTIVVFPFTKAAKMAPPQIAGQLGDYFIENVPAIARYNVVKGFLNLVINDEYWLGRLEAIEAKPDYGQLPATGKKVMVEFSSPNTNKPLHLGHIRNILLGWSTSQIQEAAGNVVFKVQIINDRGIAICKSMLAWKKFGEGETPESAGVKGDHLVGKYYVRFEQAFQEEYRSWQQTEAAAAVLTERNKEDLPAEEFFKKYKNEYFNRFSQLGAEARQMLLDWEANQPEVKQLWETMNSWVYSGFNSTYEALGVSFDKLYYESETYLLGKEFVEQGLEEGIFYQKEDGSVWIDLTEAKLDHKIVLRSDGTSVYITQDIGTAQRRYEDFGVDSMIYVVADEQNYHFKVLFETIKRLGKPYADGLHHLSYGMVDLPTGRMKSREGTVVDADDLLNEVYLEASSAAHDRGSLAEMSEAEQNQTIRNISLGALKYYILKVNPKKKMVFNPSESVDLQGNTGPYIQNAYVRIQAIQRKLGTIDLAPAAAYKSLEGVEKELIILLNDFEQRIKEAAAQLDPSVMAAYCYDLAKTFHKFYHDFQIIRAESAAAQAFRLRLIRMTGHVLARGMKMLGIEMPDRM